MAKLFGSDGGFLADNQGGVIDEQGNVLVNADTSFAASPLGLAARTQALYGIPNANFNLTPPNPSSPIVANANDLPYWSINNLSDDVMTATTIFDTTTQTWGVTIDPGTAASGSTLSLTTRSYLITDDNLALRQKALSVLSKSGTAGGTASQWNLQLSAIYYDSTDTALSTAVIGTALDTGTWTSFAGTTTPGGSAINAAAQYVDLTFTMTATAAVTGSAKATIKSLLLTTSTAATGSFLVTEYFTSSATWNVPTGVTTIYAIVGVGAGGGGGGGAFGRSEIPGGTATTLVRASGSGGGGCGAWGIIRDVALGTATSLSIGIGAGGAGGTAHSRAAGRGTVLINGTTGSSGASTTAGAFATWTGGGGGIAGTVSNATPPTTALGAPAGGSAGQYTATFYGAQSVAGTTGGAGGTVSGTANNPGTGILTVGVGAIGNSLAAGDQLTYPYTPVTAFGGNGVAAGSANTWITTQGGTAGTAQSGTARWSGGGGGSGGAFALRTGTGAFEAKAANSGNGSLFGGGGGGGASFAGVGTASAGQSGTAGAGGAGAANSGAGGGAGGAIAMANTNLSAGSAAADSASGAGGAGADGLVTIVYVA